MRRYQQDQWKEAYEMALRGYCVSAISRQTGIFTQHCRDFFNILIALGYDVQLKKRLKTSTALMRNGEDKIEASLFMMIYMALGKQAVYESIKRPILEAAFALYCEIQEEIQTSDAKSIPTINEAWAIACELLDEEAYMRRCCTCHLPSFMADKQYTSLVCPFCRPKNKHQASFSRTRAH